LTELSNKKIIRACSEQFGGIDLAEKKAFLKKVISKALEQRLKEGSDNDDEDESSNSDEE
jgi:hypothetical protein